MRTIAIYIRVSTEKQELNNQLADLKKYCQKQNWKTYKVYSDIVTGKEIKEERRPGFTEMFKDAHKRKFNIVLFWDLSRFSRAGTLYTLQKLQELKNLSIDWISYQEPYFSSLGQFSDVIISIMSTLAKIEREKISERTKSGMRRARAEGKRIGRPPIPGSVLSSIIKFAKENKCLNMREIGRQFGVSHTFVSNTLRGEIK